MADEAGMGAHDALFKRIFEDPARAAGEIRALLPPSILAAVDLASLELVPGSFVDDELADQHTDLLFRGALVTEEPVYVYFLLEHQSEPDPRMPWRVLKYQVRIWDRHEREHPGEPLPLIVPIVIHHGERGWTAPRALHELVAGTLTFPETRRFVPAFDFLLDDLVHRTDEDLLGRDLDDAGRLALWLLRDARNLKRLLAHLDAWLEALATELQPDASSDDRAALVRYLYEALGSLQFERVKAEIVRRIPQTEQTMESAADALRRQGRVQGREEGLEQGKRGTLHRLLELKFGPLDAATRERLERASIAELDVFLERFVSVASLDDVIR